MSDDIKENTMNSDTKMNGTDGADGTAASAEQSAKDPLAEVQAKLQDVEKKYLYLYSDFENFRRRAETERLNYIKFGHESFLRELIQVLDNFERAVQHAKSFPTEKSSPLGQILVGLEMIQHQFSECLKAQGVQEVKSIGEKFNPAFHEAIAEEETKDAEPQTVLKEHARGYTLHNRLLRPARVVTARQPNQEANFSN